MDRNANERAFRAQCVVLVASCLAAAIWCIATGVDHSDYECMPDLCCAFLFAALAMSVSGATLVRRLKAEIYDTPKYRSLLRQFAEIREMEADPYGPLKRLFDLFRGTTALLLVSALLNIVCSSTSDDHVVVICLSLHGGALAFSLWSAYEILANALAMRDFQVAISSDSSHGS